MQDSNGINLLIFVFDCQFQPITVLTNLQRGNVKTLNKEVTLQKLTVHEKAARGDLTLEDLNGN